MIRQTIDYGIDLGTTNSEIAYIDPGMPPVVAENNYNEKITPSAVACSNKRQLLIGKAAYAQYASHRWEDEDNVHTQFKRRMGTDDSFLFPYDGRRFFAHELSAEVLKELRLSVERRSGEKIDAAIVTIPAAFEQPQIAATRKAAELAGFQICELLQEPVAASLAYGIRDSGAKGYWLVYDLGGGTFDAALLQLKDGLIRVVNHFGDNYLGGKDIDNAILERIILPRIEEEFALDNFNRGEHRWKYAIARIKYFAEAAKIELSKSSAVDFHIDWIWDPLGEAKIDLDDFEFELTAEMLAPLYQTVFRKSMNYVKELLNQSKIDSSAIEKIILVGGPTQHPLIRAGLAEELKAPLDFSRDVMTVVAEGAAVYGSTRRLVRTKPQKAVPGTVLIDLEYEPSGADAEPNIGGSVKLGQGQEPAQFTIELVNTRTQWRSGKSKLAKNGAFIIAALAEKGLNEFRIDLCDEIGTLISTTPSSLTYNLTGLEVQATTLIHNISFSEPNGKPHFVFKKGDSLPTKATRKCYTDHLIKKGSDDALIIRLFEGNNLRFASRNSQIGHVRIEAKDMPRDLPAGQEVELKLRLDAEGNIDGTAEVMIFNMDEPYKIVWQTSNIFDKFQLSQLGEMADQALERLAKLRSSSSTDPHASEIFMKIEAENLLAEIEETQRASGCDRDQASKCFRLLSKLNEHLDSIEDCHERPDLVKKAQRAIDFAKGLTEKEASPKVTQLYQKICSEIQAAMDDPDLYALVQAVDRMDALIQSILAKYPEWWVQGFQYAEENRQLMEDPKKADLLFAQARKAIDEQKLEPLKASVVQLMRLLPQDVQDRFDEFGNVWASRSN